MKLTLTGLFALLLLQLTGFAQVLSSIKGNVKEDVSGKDIDGATIAIVRVKDSFLVKATSTDREGNFFLENVAKGTYRILSTSLGYKKTYSPPITVEGFNIDLGTFFLTTVVKSLREVFVVSKKPFIERKIDKTVINIDASILNAGGTAMDVLEASPGISVDKDGNINLKGKSGVHIIMDGKVAYLSGPQLTDLLKSIPASGLDQIEIITNPSAKYDAAGNSGIINIKTKKTKTKGFNANGSTSYGQNISSNYHNSINTNYRNEKLNLFGNYSFSDRTEYRDLSILRNYRNANSNEIETIFDQQSSLKKKSITQNANVGIDFYAGNTTLGVVFNGDFLQSKSTDDNTSLLQTPFGQTDSSLKAISRVRGHFKNTSFNTNFKHRFDSTGKELTSDIDIIAFKQADQQLLNNNYFNADESVRKPASKLRGSLPASIKAYSIKVDYTHPLQKGAKFEMGIKSSYVVTDNKAVYDNFLSNSWEPDYGKTNHFRYKEYIQAAYINYTMQRKKWEFQTGIRVEATTASGHQSGNGVNQDSTFMRSYNGVFPTVFISYHANDDNTFSFNFGRRIGRPAYQSLNPFYYFLDDYTYRIGNTQLKPQYTSAIEIFHSYKKILTTTVNYSKTSDLFAEVFKQNTGERKFIITHDNIAAREEIGFSIGATIPLSRTWNCNVYASFAHNKFIGSIDGSALNISSTALMTNMSNQFKFKKGWSADLNGWYRSKGIEGQVISEPAWVVSTGVQKELLKRKAALKLGIRDIFNSQKFSGLVRHKDIDAKIVNNNFQRTATLTFTYRLGSTLKILEGRTKGGAGEEQDRIKKG
ncbi:MAG: TonB-dependent receptor [Flaviaesturariibacter sp.]|nr:TonB-dependent receptor [Flaviaesturariibacter sp.]